MVFITVNLIAQFKAGAIILQVVLPPEFVSSVAGQSPDASYYVGLAIFAVTVVAYTTYGGFLAAIWTDVFQSLVMAIGMFLLVLTRGIIALTIVSMLMSFGNGIGSGIMQTIGADAAPDEGRRPFLGIWRLYGDSGQAIGPLIVSLVAGVATLAAGIVSVGFIGLLAAVGLAIWVPKYSSFSTPRAVRRQHRLDQQPAGGGSS